MNFATKKFEKTQIRKLAIGLFMLLIIIIAAIIVKQPPYMTLPLTVSIFIMLLQTGINRYALLLGGLNSIIYAIVDFSMGIPASAWYALLFSFPLQIIAFINWNRNKYKSSTILKSLSLKTRIVIGILFAICWVSVFTTLYIDGNPYAILDSTSSLLGILGTFLTMLAYKEYPYISLVSGVISIFLNVQVCLNDINRIPYLIFSIYSYICIIITFININKLYKEQRETLKLNTI